MFQQDEINILLFDTISVYAHLLIANGLFFGDH
jgi:hypothetical protein